MKNNHIFYNETMISKWGIIASELKFGDHFLLNEIDRGNHLSKLYLPQLEPSKKSIVAQILGIKKKDNYLFFETDVCKEVVLQGHDLVCYVEITCLPSKVQIAIAKNLNKFVTK